MQIGKGNVPLGSRRRTPLLEEWFLSLNPWNPRRMFWLQWRRWNRCVLEQERRQRCYRKMPVERKVEIFITLAQGQDGNLVRVCSEDRGLFEHWWSWLTLILEQQIHYSETGGHVLTPFLTCFKKGDFCEGKVADLEKTKKCTGLESADGIHPMDQRNMPWRCWFVRSGARPMESCRWNRGRRRGPRLYKNLDDSVIIFQVVYL